LLLFSSKPSLGFLGASDVLTQLPMLRKSKSGY
jgi:hypothetical protein